MPFCPNCGKELTEGAKFCPSCGTPSATKHSTNESRSTFYDGKIHKCPNCGEVLKALEIVCPTCKFELRGSKGATAITELTEKLMSATTEQQKINLIMNFPIPNTREDIIEFTVLATSNFNETVFQTHLGEEDTSDAWLAKIRQCKTKAQLVLLNATDREQIFRLCDDVISKAEIIKRKNKNKFIGNKNNAENISTNTQNNTPYNYAYSNHTVKRKNKWVTFFLCLFAGYFGVHKFYEGKIGMGILYLFTVGLFYIGWFYDLVKILTYPTTYYV